MVNVFLLGVLREEQRDGELRLVIAEPRRPRGHDMEVVDIFVDLRAIWSSPYEHAEAYGSGSNQWVPVVRSLTACGYHSDYSLVARPLTGYRAARLQAAAMQQQAQAKLAAQAHAAASAAQTAAPEA